MNFLDGCEAQSSRFLMVCSNHVRWLVRTQTLVSGLLSTRYKP